jgi:hypothetical protein
VKLTSTQYVQTDPKADHQVANALTELIISGSFAPVEVTDMAGDGGSNESYVSNLRQQPAPRGPAFSAEAATGATTGKTTGATGVATGKTVAAAGLGYSEDRALDDQAGHACQ